MKPTFVLVESDMNKNYEPYRGMINLQGIKTITCTEMNMDFTDKPTLVYYFLNFNYKHNLVNQFRFASKELRDCIYQRCIKALESDIYKEPNHEG